MFRFGKWIWLVGGVLLGTLGLKILGSMDAKKIYAHITAAFLRGKNYVMTNVTKAQENACDIMAQAKEINQTRSAAPEVVKDCSGTEK